MPKQTFLNLPQEKKERLLRAARNEFARVSFNEASINKIIIEAGIPRGSFYMYFEDKKDLFYFVLREYAEFLSKALIEVLERKNGDIFTTCIELFDTTITRAKDSQEDFESIRKLFANLRDSSSSNSDVALQDLLQLTSGERQKILELINTTDFKFKDLESILDLIMLLSFTTRQAIKKAFANMDQIKNVRMRFVNSLSIIQYGAVKSIEMVKKSTETFK